MTAEPVPAAGLAGVLGDRAWLRRTEPFPHVVAHDVFTGACYARLAGALRSLLARGLSERPDPRRFARNIPGYDSYGMGFPADAPEPVGLFLSPEWRDLVAGLFGVPRTPYVFAGAHHHAPGSADGFVHNDLNPVWFVRSAHGETRTPEPERCAYKDGAGPLADAEKIEVVRGVAVLFFLLNDGWRRGDGGELGLYRGPAAAADRPDAVVPPVNNSLVAFECTPRSYHAFRRNVRSSRTSIIMWVHRPMADADAVFGHDALERWA